MVMRARNIYHPVAIGADFVRKNKFELIVTGAGINLDSISLLTIYTLLVFMIEY